MRVESISYRFEQYKFVLENFMDSYMFGAGYEYVANNNFVHNYFLAILYERGIISFMLFIMLNIFILFKFIYYLINFQTRVLCFRMSVLFSGYIAILTESMFFHDYTFLVYWVFIAIVITEFENNESYKLFKKTL
jgi:O-antigen ligase